MKKRYLYLVLFAVPGFFISLIISFMLFGAAAGILWIFVFGDDPWPSWTETILPILFTFSFLITWMTFIAIGYSSGKRLEKDPLLNKGHILVSGCLTLLFILLIAFQQYSVGNGGPRSDDLMCSDYCSLQGYSASGMPPRDSGERTCSCFDESGNEVLKIPLESMIPDGSK